ncbi:hypothetical protein J3R30DRAFT_3658770 [Lentinula aciculospora]|uniref:Carboxymuconolactone decarboxylase-like domain-containing protein n=1 Tax=Lentinula aciculospora TaxID=153920 RepID=A0A9W9A6P8_9AGAR|nr:hypothetical protein J3R30DRAFT_3658770 [Lentinula aciculospora]
MHLPILPVATNPWYLVSAVAFSAGNEPQAIPEVFNYALREAGGEHDENLLLARKFRDALFKSGLTSGYAKAINGLEALHEMTIHDNLFESMAAEIFKIAHTMVVLSFEKRYADTADTVQRLLDTIYPDMGFFSNTIGYGYTYGFIDILSPLETSYVLVVSLIASDTPRQINWHLDGARRNGATLEEVKAVRQIAIEAAVAAGVKWKDGVREIEDS